jgi:hypothetical protein
MSKSELVQDTLQDSPEETGQLDGGGSGKSNSTELEILADWQWALENREQWTHLPPGDHVAIANRKIWGHGPNACELLDQVSRESNLHRNRFVMIYLEKEMGAY